MEEIIVMICKDIVEEIIGYIEAELDDKTLEELNRHLNECPECKAFVKTYKRMLELADKVKERTFVTPETRAKLKALLLNKLRFIN